MSLPQSVAAALFLICCAPSALANDCLSPGPEDPVLLVVVASDPALASKVASVERAVRRAGEGRWSWLGAGVASEVAGEESGAADRARAVIEARAMLLRAEERFRELEDDDALDILASATARLVAAQVDPDAVELLGRAHLLAGAIYLARDRIDAARQRIERALDLAPNLDPAHDRYSPRMLAEVAAVRAGAAFRPTGRLELELSAPLETAAVFLDGRAAGNTPLVLEDLGEGRHLIRVSALGYKSHTGSLEIEPARTTRTTVRLAPDPETKMISSLADHLQLGQPVDPILTALARRADAAFTILAVPVMAAELTQAGTATLAVELSLVGAGRARASRATRVDIAAALDRLLRCVPEAPAPALAPSLLGFAEGRTRPLGVPDEEPLWARSWFWAACAVAALGVAGAVAAARTSGGPPEAVEITLIPRP